MPRPDEGLIHAWLDGELDAAEAARVEQLVAEDREWAAAAAEARGLIAASTRILGALDVVAGDVIPQGGSAAPGLGQESMPSLPRPTRRRTVPTWMKMAAGLVLVAGIGYLGRDGIGFTAPNDEMRVETAPPPVAPQAAVGAVNAAAEADAGARDLRRSAGETEARIREDAPRPEQAARGAGAPAPVASIAPVTAAAPAASPPSADAVAPLASNRAASTTAAASTATGAPAAGSALTRARQASIDSQPQRRNLGDVRLEGVVVTGVTSGVAGAAADRVGERSLQSKAAKAVAPAATLQSESAPPLPIIEGCFRVRTRARIDTLLIDPTILATDADSLRIELNRDQGFAWVRREASGALVGRVWWQRGTATLRADPIDCS